MTIIARRIDEKASLGVVPASISRAGLAEPLKFGVFDHVFRRTVVKRADQPALMERLRKEAEDPGFIYGLEAEPGRSVYTYPYSADSGKTDVIVKNTHSDYLQGDKPEDVRAAVADLLRSFQPKTRDEVGRVPSPKGYEVHMPRYYGRINDGLIAMEHVDGKGLEHTLGLLDREGKTEVAKSLREASDNYRGDLEKARSKNPLIDRLLHQSGQVMVAGHTNPKELKNGNWVFFIPYDFH